MTLLDKDECFLKYETGKYPESVSRRRRIHARLRDSAVQPAGVGDNIQHLADCVRLHFETLLTQ